MQKIKELRMALVILVIGVFFISGCFFDKKYEVTLKTNGGSKLDSLVIKSGDKIEDIKKPTKKGYKFLGWYSNGKEFDFDTKIEEDITLVAKWEKIEIDYEEEVEESTTTSTTTTTSKKVVKTTKKKTTSKSSKKKTTTKKITTTKKKEDTTTTSTTTTTTTTSTTTSTTTTAPVEITTIPITTVVPVIPPVDEEPTTTKSVEVKMAITEVQKAIDDETTPDIDETSYVITLDLEAETPTVNSKITDEDYAFLINSDKSKWVIENNYEVVYENIYDEETPNKIKLEGKYTDVTSIMIFDGTNYYALNYDYETLKWELNYPVAKVGVGLDVKYYGNINLAFVKALEGDTVTLLRDIELKESIRLYDAITIDGNGYKLSVTGTNIFILESLDKETATLIINNLTTDGYNFMYVSDDTKLEKILIKDSKIKYSNVLFNEEMNVTVDYENTEVTSILN